MKVPVSVIILTYNEENNIRACLESIGDFTDSIFIVDSGSTDATVAIAKEFGIDVIYNKFDNYGQQRNWALSQLSIPNDWIINMDADHRLTTALKTELINHFTKGISNEINGFLVSRKTIFMGKWIRYGGHYPTYHANIFRRGKGRCEEKLYDQHFLVEGATIKLKGDIVDLITESLTTFTERHNKWATLESIQQTSADIDENKNIKGSITGNAIQLRRYIKNIYEKFPLFVRPFIYFIIRYFFRLGFLDGTRGLIFHFLQCFWFRFLIDAKIYERKQIGSKNNESNY